MKKHLIRFIAATLVLAAALTLCACKEIPPERVSYLPAQKSISCVSSGREMQFTADYEWTDNSCVATFPGFFDNVTVTTDGPGELYFSDMTLTFTYDGQNNSCRLQYKQNSADIIYDFTLDSEGRVSRIDYYENTENPEKIVTRVSYADAYTITVENENYPKINSVVRLDRENRTAVLTKLDAEGVGTALKYDRDGNVWPDREDFVCEYSTAGDIRKLTYSDGLGIADTVFSDYNCHERWHRLADTFINVLIFGFTSDGFYSKEAADYFAAFCVTSCVI